MTKDIHFTVYIKLKNITEHFYAQWLFYTYFLATFIPTHNFCISGICLDIFWLTFASFSVLKTSKLF